MTARPPPSERKLRLQPLSISSIPAHPSLSSLQSASSAPLPALRPFILSVLAEAVSFADEFVPAAFKAKGAPKASPPAGAKVQLYSYEDAAEGESWFARRSEHSAVERMGTASWREFREGILDDHSVHEAEYTPNVLDAHKVLDWAAEIEKLTEEDGSGSLWQGYSEVVMEIYEMAHKIPPPLQNRVFPVLVVRALTPSTGTSTKTTSSTGPPSSFILAQIPIDLTTTPNAIYSTDRHRTDTGVGKFRDKVTVGAYVSVERVKLVGGDEGAASEQNGNGDIKLAPTVSGSIRPKIIWEMATASDAKGNLPMAMQKMGVPGAIVKDVGLFMKWTGERRGN